MPGFEKDFMDELRHLCLRESEVPHKGFLDSIKETQVIVKKLEGRLNKEAAALSDGLENLRKMREKGMQRCSCSRLKPGQRKDRDKCLTCGHYPGEHDRDGCHDVVIRRGL